MNKKLPKIFANKIDKNITNNESVYYSNLNRYRESYNWSSSNKTVYEKINDIFKSEKYVYKADVIIKTKNDEISTRIIGHNNNYLITFDNKLILISDIEDIKLQK